MAYHEVFAWFLGFLTIDMSYVYFFVSKKATNKPAIAILIFASFFASLPLLTDSLFWGHDLDFHLNRIMALANGLEAGHIFVPIQTEVLNGYGYASPLFYSQLFLYLPAILYNLAVPIQVCYQIYAILVNILTCGIAYYSFKGIVRDNQIAAAGALIYLLSSYRITNLFIRAAIGGIHCDGILSIDCVWFCAHLYRGRYKVGNSCVSANCFWFNWTD